MNLDRTGFILYTIKYQECVDFYKNILELPVLFKAENLTCFSFGNAYLMIELDKDYHGEKEKNQQRIQTCLRMNVSQIRELSDKLISKGIKVNYQEHSWGTVAKFFDPDGNLCAFKDSEKFEKQIIGYKK
ncbi:glyoxalase/bleomycin resistance/dioxygenase family protein [Tenacibaculum tangerinum]|uniref:Glyoxalase/bleomycin resistance/dioxygenase family protein n=1 Tax=Tenacibaculum tangerinum TaxID=3038772 RepID=A0ABY8L372_9FLAO|nr:VOC family protein [Tenacibaculum tangerinum]WGH74565.1 glyoxalase/bleomycin resistance/dioxygenase family protein [Tenacibaculum tangerinum]